MPYLADHLSGPSIFRAAVIGVALGALAVGFVAYERRAVREAPLASLGRDAAPSAEDRKKQELLRLNATLESDPALASEYATVNADYFDGQLPMVRVRWEPRLDEVGPLISEQFRLEGLTDGHQILVNPSLRDDPSGLRRVLCHEIVHVAIWDKHDEHGPLFQSTLRRLSEQGAFDGIVATAEEREQLRMLMATRATELDTEGTAMRSARAALDADVAALEADVSSLNARIAAANQASAGWPAESEAKSVEDRRRVLQERTGDYNFRVAKYQASIADYNQMVERYNLMVSYPDGLDRQRATRR